MSSMEYIWNRNIHDTINNVDIEIQEFTIYRRCPDPFGPVFYSGLNIYI